MFAAHKTHRQQNDLHALLVDESGHLKSWEQFSKDAQPIVGDYNRRWLRTEYDTCVIRARMAARFLEFQRDADLYPNLKWLESTSVEKREIHKALYGLILPINHPFWLKEFPGDLWECKCGITNTDEEPNGDDYGIGSYRFPALPPGLDGNPAVTGKIYSDSNNYQANGYPGADKAAVAFLHKYLLHYADAELKKWVKTLPEHNGLLVKSEALASGNMRILRKVASTVKEHNGNFDKLMYLPGMESDLDNWKYIGWKKVERYPEGHKLAGKLKHNNAEYFTYYRVNVNGKKMYAQVKMHRVFKTEVLYCITEKLGKGVKKGLPPGIKK